MGSRKQTTVRLTEPGSGLGASDAAWEEVVGAGLRIANRGTFLTNQRRFYRELGHEFGLQ